MPEQKFIEIMDETTTPPPQPPVLCFKKSKHLTNE